MTDAEKLEKIMSIALSASISWSEVDAVQWDPESAPGPIHCAIMRSIAAGIANNPDETPQEGFERVTLGLGQLCGMIRAAGTVLKFQDAPESAKRTHLLIHAIVRALTQPL